MRRLPTRNWAAHRVNVEPKEIEPKEKQRPEGPGLARCDNLVEAAVPDPWCSQREPRKRWVGL